MRILQVQRISGFAGSEKYILELSAELKKQQIVSDVLCIYAVKDKKNIDSYLARLKKLDIKYYLIEENSILSYGLIKKVKEVVDKGYDIVQTHLIYADVYMALVKMLFKNKITIISTKHGYNEKYYENDGFIKPYIPITSPYYYIARFAEKFIDQSFSVSDGIARVYKHLRITQNLTPTIYHGIKGKDIDFDLKKNKRFAKYQLLVVGRLAPLKGQLYTITVLEHLLKQFSKEVKLVLVGGNSGYEDHLKVIVKEKNLEDYVIFEGFQKDVASYYLSSDVVLVPSKAEAFGFIFLEAFNAKRAVVAFDVPAGNEIVINNESGFLIPPFDTTIMAEKVQELLENAELRNRFGQNGYNRLLKYFSIERMIEETVELYQKILKGGIN